MNKNKFVTCALAAMMLASLAIPASAADVNKDYGNTTDVVLNYEEDTPAGPNVDGQFTIKIPSEVKLTATDNGAAGVKLTGTGEIEFSGMIGQNDVVPLRMTSANDYQLKDEDTGYNVAKYQIGMSTDKDNGVELKGDAVFITGDTHEVSANYAKAFQGDAKITMTFSENGDNSIFGKGDYSDTLTFEYGYNNDEWQSLNINNGEVAEEEANLVTTWTTSKDTIISYYDNDKLVVTLVGGSYNLDDGTYTYTVSEDGGYTYISGTIVVKGGQVINQTCTKSVAITNRTSNDFGIVVNSQEVIDNFEINFPT